MPTVRQPGNKGENAKRYNNDKWRKLSRRTRIAHNIKTEGYGCEVCYHANIMTDVLDRKGVCDHLIPVNAGGAFWDKRNHMSMCNSCHNIKRGYEKGGLGVAVSPGKKGLIPTNRMDIVNKLLKRDGNQQE